MIRCRFCGQPNEPGTKFCINPACGMYQWDGEDEPPGEQNGSPPPPPPPPVLRRAYTAAGATRVEEERPRAAEERTAPSPGAARGGRISMAITLMQTELQVEPPNLVTCEVLVRNTGALVDQFMLTLEGAAAIWGTVEPAALNLYPESEPATALISFQPPRSPDTPAGPALFVVRATSREDPSISATAAGVLLVDPYIDVTTALVPQTSKGKKGGEHELTLSNRGNGEVRANLMATDPDKQLNFSADPPELEVPPGGEAVSRIEVVPRKRTWVGKPKVLPFSVGTKIGSAAPIRSDGRHEQLPVIPSWMVKLAVAVLVPLVALIVYLLTTAKIPPVVGATRAVAVQRLQDAGFDATFKNVASAEVPAGSVVSTEPPRAGRILKSTEVAAFVSAGANPVEVPDVRGLDAGVARAQLLAAGLTSRAVEGENSRVGPGQVFATDPGSGELLPPEAQVVLNVRPGGTTGQRQGLGDAGPVDPTTGFPAWYPDNTESGLRLELCLAGDPFCGAGRDAFVASPPDGMADYWAAETVPFASPLNGGPITFRSALVAAFGAGGQAGCAPRACAERTYTVIEVSAAEGTLEPGKTYVVTHPFGTSTYTTDETGAITPEIGREEVGCISNPPEECNWNAVKEGRVGPFLVWDGQTLPPPPPGYVGDRSTPHRVTGSPVGTNFVKITGPGLADGLVVEEFLVEGKVSTTSAPPPGQSGAAPSTTSVAAPPQRAGVTSSPIPVEFTNNGSGNLVVSDVQVAGDNNQDWSLVSQDCTGHSIPAGGKCTANVAVTPSAGGPTNGKLTIFSNAFGSPAIISLSSTATAPAIEPTPREVNFANSIVNQVSPSTSITLKNAGTADLSITGAEITGQDPGDFVVASNGCSAKVKPGQSCSIKVAVKALGRGKRNASLSIFNDAPLAGSRFEVPLSGNGQAPAAAVGPATLILADQEKGDITVSNQGDADLTVDAKVLGDAGKFVLSADDCKNRSPLKAGGKCTLSITFHQDVNGLLNCAVSSVAVTTNDPKTPELSVQLIGRATISGLLSSCAT